MKIIAKIMAVLSIILLSSLSLSGQKMLLLQDVQPMMAYASASHYDIELSADYNSNTYQFYMEEQIQLKNWMTNSKEWKTSGNSRLAADLQEDSEGEVQLEDWMTDSFDRDKDRLNSLVKVEEETPLKLDKWMYCCTDWKIAAL